jgi:hypothetical protein
MIPDAASSTLWIATAIHLRRLDLAERAGPRPSAMARRRSLGLRRALQRLFGRGGPVRC